MTQKLHSLLRSVGLTVPSGLANPEIEMLTCDSRSVSKGSLFLGLPGKRIDGGSFWQQAISAGAAAAIIGPKAAGANPPGSNNLVVVVPKPAERWIGEIASAFFGKPSSRMSLIGVTGTNGKTTITHLIEYLGGSLGKPTALFGTLVNRWPAFSSTSIHTTDFADKLQSHLAKAIDSGVELGAMEVSSHALEQKRVAGCLFAGAVFTNLTQDHLDYHSSMEEYFEVKASLFSSPLLTAGANRVVVNVDDPWGELLSRRLGSICWRSSLEDCAIENGKAELTINEVEISASGVEGLLISPLGEGKFFSPLIGRFNLMNLLQAVGVLIQQGFPLKPLLASIADFPGVPGRMERVELKEVDKSLMPTVLVDYAHTPDGLKNALEALKPFTKGQLICVFGCGGDRDRTKRPEMGRIVAELSNRIFLTSDNPRTEDPQQILKDVLSGIPAEIPMTVKVDRSEAIALSIAESSPTDVILIAGKGHEKYQILGTQKVHFDDREQAEIALKNKIKSH